MVNSGFLLDTKAPLAIMQRLLRTLQSRTYRVMNYGRYYFLTLCLIFFAQVGRVQTGPAFDMTQTDRTRTLYSNQLAFDRRGEPLVSIRITENQSAITLKTKNRMRILPNGNKAAQFELQRGSTWRFTVKDSTPAKVRLWLTFGEARADDFATTKKLLSEAKALGLTTRRFESGSVMGLKGTILDTRRIVIAVGPYNDLEHLAAAQKKLSKDRGKTPAIFRELLAPAKGTIIATEKKAGLQILAQDVLWMESGSESPIVFDRLVWGQGTPKRGTERRSYDGQIYITVGQDGKLAAVNVLSAERLLEGVVPSELYTSAPLNALRAQAVAARGQLLAKIGTRHLADPYLLCAETHCQVYTGLGRIHKRSSQAVRDTHGHLLFDKEGLVDTTYSSTCGGHSESFHLVWGGQPKSAHPGFRDRYNSDKSVIGQKDVEAFVRSTPKAFCRASGLKAKTFRWQKKVTGTRITKAVKAHKNIGDVLNFVVKERGRSGRALSIEYEGTRGRVLIKGEYTNRKVLGHLKSALWIVTNRDGAQNKEPRMWYFAGAGFGHGVGMCQHGAMGMARKGYDWAKILKHYYRGSRLEKLW